VYVKNHATTANFEGVPGLADTPSHAPCDAGKNEESSCGFFYVG